MALFFSFNLGTNPIYSNIKNKSSNLIKTDYLSSRKELDDYIVDTGDSLAIKYFPAEELNSIFSVNEEGEIILPLIQKTYVRGLTTSEISNLLEKKYSEILISPEIQVFISKFKNQKINISGEVRNPGLYVFPSYISASFLNSQVLNDSKNIQDEIEGGIISSKITRQNVIKPDFLLDDQEIIKSAKILPSNNIITVSKAIKKAGGITSSSDLSKVQIIRNVPMGKGGGKKYTTIDLENLLEEAIPQNDFRLFHGDTLIIPKLTKKDLNQIPRSILSGLSPKFINVTIYGRVETPGIVSLPLEATLSDAIDLTGPIRPLSGKIVLIRYLQDGNVIKKNIRYSSSSRRGSKNNPYIKEGDLISVRNSWFGKSTGVIREFTAPFVGIYSTKELIESFTGNND